MILFIKWSVCIHGGSTTARMVRPFHGTISLQVQVQIWTRLSGDCHTVGIHITAMTCLQVGGTDAAQNTAGLLKFARLLMLIVLLYITLYVPTMAIASYLARNKSETLIRIYYLSLNFFFLSTWINPLIFAWKNENLRKCFYKMLPAYCTASWHSSSSAQLVSG